MKAITQPSIRGFDSIPDIISAIGRGEIVILVDDADRENEGDLVLAAEATTAEKISFMLRYSSGIVCLSIVGERLDELEIPMMVANNTDVRRTAFTVSVDAASGTSTGISASDRATTIRAMLDPATSPQDLTRPGHVYPIRYQSGGVLRRAGHSEAAVDLARLANVYPAGVIAEVMNDDGSVARLPDLMAFAETHGLRIGTIADLIAYRVRSETLVERTVEALLPTRYGTFTAVGFSSPVDSKEHVALVYGDIGSGDDVLTRVHSECLTGDILGSLLCDCGQQLDWSLARIAEEGRGVVLYIRGHEGRGIGLLHKLAAYRLQEQGFDTIDANLQLGLPVDSRNYGVGAQVLRNLGIRSLRLMTNSPVKRAGLEGHGLAIAERVPIPSRVTKENRRYLETKATRMGHDLQIEG